MTASRDLALCRRMLAEFRREAGRDFDAGLMRSCGRGTSHGTASELATL